MKHSHSLASIVALLLPCAASAEAPKVLTDIAPIQSLTARVMEGVGSPDVILPPTVSPHDFSLRPSDARHLSNADVVIWVGENLTPYLEDPIESLATNASSLELLGTEGWEKRVFGEGHDEHDHEEGEDHDHDHAEGDHDHDDHAGHDHHGHHHTGVDPHAWLDPEVAIVWTMAIAETLAEADPANAAQYRANADAAQLELKALSEDIAEKLESVSGEFVVPHDAYGYFSARFGLEAAGSIADHDAATPGPARIAELRETVAEQGVECVMADVMIAADWPRVVAEGTDARSGVLDPIGRDLPLGSALYPALLTQMADAFADCLGS